MNRADFTLRWFKVEMIIAAGVFLVTFVGWLAFGWPPRSMVAPVIVIAFGEAARDQYILGKRAQERQIAEMEKRYASTDAEIEE